MLRSGSIGIEDLPDPVPGRDEVLVRSHGTGICGSDQHFKHRSEAGIPQPIVLGHEFCVEVMDYGPGTEPTIPVGDRATANPFVQQGGLIGFSLPGAMAEMLVLPATSLVRVPDELPSHTACLTEPVAVGIRAVAAAEARCAGGPYLVVGCGPIGLAVIAALRAQSKGPVVASDISPLRRSMASAFGADVVVDPLATSPLESWINEGVEFHPVSPLLAGAEPVASTIFECVGSGAILADLISGAAPHTVVVSVGVAAAEHPLPLAVASSKELCIEFVMGYLTSEFEESLRRIAAAPKKYERLITTTVGLEGVDCALAAMAQPDRDVKVIVDPRI